MQLEKLNGAAAGGERRLSSEELVDVLIEGIAPKGSPLEGDRGAVLNDMAAMFDDQARSAAKNRESVEGPEASAALEARIAELEAMKARAAALFREETGKEWAAG